LPTLLHERPYSHDETLMSTVLANIFSRMAKRTILLHILCWSLFISYELGFLYYTSLKFASRTLFVFVLYYAVNIFVFYSHLVLLNFTFTRSGNFFKGVLFFMLQLAIFMLAKAGIDILLTPGHLSQNLIAKTLKAYFFVNLFRGFYFCIYATFYWVAGNIANYREIAAISDKKQLLVLKEKAEIETRFAETRNAYLQQQLNPHLLFNALSFIYSSVHLQSEKGGRCVLLLSDILRFSLENSDSDGKKPLSSELEQINNLVEINRYRFDYELCLQMNISLVPDEARIIPLLLLTLTENIFKHGQLEDPAHPAILKIGMNEKGIMTFFSRNIKQVKSSKRKRRAIGLQNTRIRLEHSYPGLHELAIKEDEQFFELTLIMQL